MCWWPQCCFWILLTFKCASLVAGIVHCLWPRLITCLASEQQRQ